MAARHRAQAIRPSGLRRCTSSAALRPEGPACLLTGGSCRARVLGHRSVLQATVWKVCAQGKSHGHCPVLHKQPQRSPKATEPAGRDRPKRLPSGLPGKAGAWSRPRMRSHDCGQGGSWGGQPHSLIARVGSEGRTRVFCWLPRPPCLAHREKVQPGQRCPRPAPHPCAVSGPLGFPAGHGRSPGSLVVWLLPRRPPSAGMGPREAWAGPAPFRASKPPKCSR